MKPTFRSRRLGRWLRQYRDETGMDQATVAAKIGVRQPHLSNLESGRAKLVQPKLGVLCDVLNIPAPERAELERLAIHADVPGWWQRYGSLLPEATAALIELESEACWIKTYDNMVFPGLLQTQAYAEAMISASTMHDRVADLDQYVQLRMRRQKRLADPDCRLTAVVGEAALYQEVGGQAVLREQLQHVVRMMQHDVTVNLVPFTAGAHPALTDQFVIIEWSRESDPEAVYVDGQTSWTIHEGPGVTRQYSYAFAAVHASALSARDSLRRIKNRYEELTRWTGTHRRR